MAKAYSYVRFSTSEQMQGDSLRRQTSSAVDYAQRHGLELDDALTFEDRGISGFHGSNARKGALRRFLDAVEQDLIPAGSFLLVENLDRMSRQDPWEALPTFQQIINAGITIVTLQDGRVWSREELRAQPFRIMESLMVMIRANEESATKSRRGREARKALRAAIVSGQNKRVFTSRCPAWLIVKPDKTGFDVIEERAATVRRVFKLAASGVGQHGIAAVLNKEGLATWGDNGRAPAPHWRRSYIVKLLSSPAVMGTYVPHTVEVRDGRKVRTAQPPIPNYYPAVVAPEIYQQLQALRIGKTLPARGRHAHSEVRNILAGLGRCGSCGAAMTRVTKGSSTKAGKPYLVCEAAKVGRRGDSGQRVCQYRTVSMDDVETAIREHGWEAIAEAPLPEQHSPLDGNIEGKQVLLSDLRERAAALVDVIERGGPSSLADRLRDLETQIAVEQRELESLEGRRAATFGPFLLHRMKALETALEATPFDRAAANVQLRVACSSVRVDYHAGMLVFSWVHGGESGMAYGPGDWPGVTPKRETRKVAAGR